MRTDRVFAGADLYAAALIGFEFLALGIRDGGLKSIIVTIASALIACCYFNYIDRGCLRGIFSAGKGMTAHVFISCMALIILAQILSSNVLYLIESLLNQAGFTALMSPAATTDFSATWSMLIYGVIAGPIAEEIVFRGLLLRALKPLGRVLQILTQALIFSLMHGDITQLALTFMVGVILGYVATEYSIVWAWLLHVFNNGFLGVILMSLPWTIVTAVFIMGFVIGIYCILRHFRDIGRYLREHGPVQGAGRAFLNIWFVVFVIFELFSVVLTIRRV